MTEQAGDPPAPTLDASQRERLLAAIDAYTEAGGHAYDELFVQVQRRIAASGSAGKLDVAAITFWRRLAQGSWIGDLLRMSEGSVRRATGCAFTAADDRGALRALAELPGFDAQGPLATALLCANRPYDFAVMDRRAKAGLKSLGRGLGTSRGMTLRYFRKVRQLRDELATLRPGLTARDIDKGLYMLGAPPE
jgi:hypothetical protein